MAKFYGAVGYARMAETGLDIHEEIITERMYSGDVLEDSRKWVQSEYLNDKLVVNNNISIVADPYAYQNYDAIRYVVWNGVKWKVTNTRVAYPRLLLYLGGLYNEQK